MLVTIVISLGITVVVYFGLAFAFILSDRPPEIPAAGGASIGFSDAIDVDYSTLPETRAFTADDGSRLPYRQYGTGSENLIVLVHGSAWHGMQFHRMASRMVSRGLVVRFAGGRHGSLADAFVLMAPFLQYNAPQQNQTREAGRPLQHAASRACRCSTTWVSPG